MTLEISNTASDITVDIQTEASARWRPVHERKRQDTVVECDLGVPGQILQSRKSVLRFKSPLCLPSTKTKADRARFGFGIFSVIVQKAFRVKLRGVSICSWVIEHEPVLQCG
jgi:hypothetical protein